MCLALQPPRLLPACRRTSKRRMIRDPVGRQSPKPDLAAAFENLMDREVALEDEVAAVLDLPDGVKARQVDLMALGAGELRSQDQCPVIELLLNDLGTKPVGGSLEDRDIVDGHKCVIVLSSLRTPFS